MSGYILALDQGTTSSRAIVFDRDGHPVASAQQEFTQHYPRPGWIEHDPFEIWSSQREVMRRAATNAGVGPADLAGIGITNQRETTIVWDRQTGRPVHNAVVWQDRRTAGYIDGLKQRGLEAFFRERTGLVLDAYFSASKLAWLLEHVDGVREAARAGRLAFGTVDTWLLWQLTGGAVHATDATNASRTLMFNIHSLEWDGDILRELDIPASLLPEVRSSSEVYGETVDEVLGRPVPIAGIAGDQHAATFGQACFEPGQAKNTYGTGCFLLLNTGDRPVASENKLLTTIGWRRADETVYALEGSIFVAGAVVQWLRDELGLIDSAADIEALAGGVADNGGVYLVPAFAGLGAPHWDPYARGAVFGLTRGSNAGHLARAALEAIAFQVADVVAAMNRDSGIDLKELRVDGGACSNDLLMQIQADLLGVPVVRPRITETTALGAACLAGLATGFWEGPSEIAARWQEDRRFEPNLAGEERERMLAQWHKAVERAGDWGE